MYHIWCMRIIFICWLIALSIKLEAQKKPLNLKLTQQTDTVTTGLIHHHYHSDTMDGSPLNIHLLEIDLSKIRVQHVLAMDQIIGQETTSHMCQRRGALAGVNGGFSFFNDAWNIYHGDPRDFFMIKGKILSEPYATRSSFGIYYDTLKRRSIPFFDRIAWNGIVIIDQDTFTIDGINRIKENDEMILYTPEWGNSTLTTAPAQELIIRNDRQYQVSNHGSSSIPSNGYVLALPNNFKIKNNYQKIEVKHLFHSLLSPAKEIKLKNTSYNTAGPLLLNNGNIIQEYAAEDISSSFINTRHPRTAVGISKDENTLYLLTVDGRQQALSMGMSLPELAGFLKDTGSYHAYNLDGGGSTTMVINNKIVNSPSDPQERRRCDGVLLFPLHN